MDELLTNRSASASDFTTHTQHSHCAARKVIKPPNMDLPLRSYLVSPAQIPKHQVKTTPSRKKKKVVHMLGCLWPAR